MTTRETSAWLDTLSGIDLAAARQVQRALDLSLWAKLPEPEVRELSLNDLTPRERAQFGVQFADTEVRA